MTYVLLALAVAAPAPKPSPKVDNPLVGTWELESATFFGTPVPDLKMTMKFTADGGYESSTSQAGRTRSEAGTYARDPKPDPHHLNLAEPGAEGRTTLSIYKVGGDTLTICSGDKTTRPTAFEAPGGAVQVLMVFKRVKPKD